MNEKTIFLALKYFFNTIQEKKDSEKSLGATKMHQGLQNGNSDVKSTACGRLANNQWYGPLRFCYSFNTL